MTGSRPVRTALVYEGEVILECQEGGFATPTIALMELDPTGREMDITSVVKVMGGAEVGKPLADLLAERFGTGERSRMGDESLGRLRITVERATE